MPTNKNVRNQVTPVANITGLVCQSILSERQILNFFVHSSQLHRCQRILHTGTVH